MGSMYMHTSEGSLSVKFVFPLFHDVHGILGIESCVEDFESLL